MRDRKSARVVVLIAESVARRVTSEISREKVARKRVCEAEEGECKKSTGAASVKENPANEGEMPGSFLQFEREGRREEDEGTCSVARSG